MLEATPNPRSRCPCQSMPTSTPSSATSDFTNETSARAPLGVAWPTRIGHAQPLRARPNRGGKEAAQRLGIRARGVLGDVHHLDAFLDREGERILGAFLEEVERPPFGVLADRARSDERAAFDGHAGPLLDLRDRPDVGHHRARRAVGADAQADRPRSRAPAARRPSRPWGRRPGDRCRPCRSPAGPCGAGCRSSARNRRRANRRRLQPVAQRLVRRASRPACRGPAATASVPVVRSADAALGATGSPWMVLEREAGSSLDRLDVWRGSGTAGRRDQRPARWTAARPVISTRGARSRGDPETAGDGRSHPVVHVGKWPTGHGGSSSGGGDIVPPRDHDHMVEHHVPHDHRPGDQRARATRAAARGCRHAATRRRAAASITGSIMARGGRQRRRA